MNKYQEALKNIEIIKDFIDTQRREAMLGRTKNFSSEYLVKTFHEIHNAYYLVKELVDKATVLRPISEWCEELDDCLWWKVPIDKPPYYGSPLNDDFPWYVTHFTQPINLDWSDENEC